MERWQWLSVRRRFLTSTCALIVGVSGVATVGAAPASADSTIDGCTIVTRPTHRHFTNCPGADLTGANLAGVDLSFANLSGAKLVSANLAAAGLRRANLSNAVLATCVPQPDLTVICKAADLNAADLTRAALTGAQLFGVDLASTKMHAANLANASLASCFFTINGPQCAVAGLDHADLSAASLAGAITSSCQSLDLGDGIGVINTCGGVSMTFANFAGTDLSHTDLSFTNLAHSNLKHARLRTATFGECALASKLEFEICGGANLSNTDLAHVNLSGLRLNGVNFAGAHLVGANLSGADMSALGLPDFPFVPTVLALADLRHADLRGANLTLATLAGSNLHRAKLGAITWAETTCPDGTNSDADGNTCINNL